MQQLDIYIRNEKPNDRDFISRMLEAAGIQDWELKDLAVHDVEDVVTDNVSLAIGTVTSRLVKDSVKSLYVLPILSSLEDRPGNEIARKKAWEILKELKKILEGEIVQQKEYKWTYAILKQGDRRICVYTGPTRPDITADSYISNSDVSKLLELQIALGSDKIVLLDTNREEHDLEKTNTGRNS